MPNIPIIGKLVPANNGFTGLIDAEQVIGLSGYITTSGVTQDQLTSCSGYLQEQILQASGGVSMAELIATSGTLHAEIVSSSGTLNTYIGTVNTAWLNGSGTLNTKLVNASGALHSEIGSASGSLHTEIGNASGTLNTAWTNGSGALHTEIGNASGTLNTKINNISGSLYSGYVAADSTLSGLMYTGLYNASGTLHTEIGNVSGALHTEIGNLSGYIPTMAKGAAFNGSTSNYIQKYVGLSLSNSALLDNGTNMGVHQTNPQAQIDNTLTAASTNGSLEVSRFRRYTSGGMNGAMGGFNSFYTEDEYANDILCGKVIWGAADTTTSWDGAYKPYIGLKSPNGAVTLVTTHYIYAGQSAYLSTIFPLGSSNYCGYLTVMDTVGSTCGKFWLRATSNSCSIKDNDAGGYLAVTDTDGYLCLLGNGDGTFRLRNRLPGSYSTYIHMIFEGAVST